MSFDYNEIDYGSHKVTVELYEKLYDIHVDLANLVTKDELDKKNGEEKKSFLLDFTYNWILSQPDYEKPAYIKFAEDVWAKQDSEDKSNENIC